MKIFLRKIIQSVVIMLVFFLCSATAFAGIRKGPYLMYEGSNTSMTVLWQTDAAEANVIRWGTNINYTMGQATVGVVGTDFQHEHVIMGLQPNTKYYYQVDGYGSGSFRTAPDVSATSVKLFAYGDTRSYPVSQEQVVATMRSVYAADPAFQSIVLHSGDWIDSDAETAWSSEWFVSGTSYPQIHALQMEVPIVGARGNHEGAGIIFDKYYPFPYVNAFYWSFDYGPAHIIVLDEYASYAPGSAQYNWLVDDLASTPKSWKILLTHEPGWGAGTGANNTDIQNIIHPLIKQYDVDLFVNGHNHNYARALVEGKTYITTGGGGAPLYTPDPSYPNIVKVDKSYHYTEIDVRDSTLTITAVRANGSVIETVTITHSATDTAPPTAPLLTSIALPTSGNTKKRLILNWTASIDNIGVTGYDIYQATGSCTAPFSLVTTDTASPYTDTRLRSGTTYCYYLVARDAAGNKSVPSNKMSGKAK